MTRTRFWMATVLLAVAVGGVAHYADGKTLNNTLIVIPEGHDGGAAVVTDLPSSGQTEGCFQATCNTVGDGGVVRLVIPVDGGVLYPQANTRYRALMTSGSAARINQNGACDSFTSYKGQIVNEGSTLSWLTRTNPDGGVGNLTDMHCCSQSGSSDLFQLCPR